LLGVGSKGVRTGAPRASGRGLKGPGRGGGIYHLNAGVPSPDGLVECIGGFEAERVLVDGQQFPIPLLQPQKFAAVLLGELFPTDRGVGYVSGPRVDTPPAGVHDPVMVVQGHQQFMGVLLVDGPDRARIAVLGGDDARVNRLGRRLRKRALKIPPQPLHGGWIRRGRHRERGDGVCRWLRLGHRRHR
jgi:hypothetical protein